MMALAGYPLGLRSRALDPSPDAPAADVAELVTAPFDDTTGLDRLAHGSSVVTFEFEQVPAASIEYLADRVPVAPGAASLAATQDRLTEKTVLAQVGIRVGPFAPVDDARSVEAAVAELGGAAVLKTRRFGYDGKGQEVVRSSGDAPAAWERIGAAPAIAEAVVDFERELSIVAVRDHRGRMGFYPLAQNHHRNGILMLTVAPAPRVTPELQRAAEDYAAALMEHLDHVGVLAIELFDVGTELLANEVAPRVHNSGHWTIDGAHTSQFENHMRAVTGAPLGSTAARGVSAMLNLLSELPDRDRLLAQPLHPHLYDKAPRPGRKLGHATVLARDHSDLVRRLDALRAIAGPEGTAELDAAALWL